LKFLQGGQIVLADWRDNALPTEANKLRPAIVADDDGLFDPGLITVLLVPLTGDANAAMTATSKLWVTITPSHITSDQLATIRQQIALGVGAQP
jgi:mRNA interferase MazF